MENLDVTSSLNLYDYLRKEIDIERIDKLCNECYWEGHLEKIEECYLCVLPIINIAYYKSSYLDDCHYAYEDLIQDVCIELYRTMRRRWDLLIYVENYYMYFFNLCNNIIRSLVLKYHNYYSTTEFDPDLSYHVSYDKYNNVDDKILLDEYNEIVKSKNYDKLIKFINSLRGDTN